MNYDLTDADRRALPYIEQYWHDYDRLPSSEKIEGDIKGFKYELAMVKPKFITALQRRGVKTPPVETRYGDRIGKINYEGLSEHQIAVAVSLTDFYDSRTRTAKLKQLGITSTAFNGWMRDPKFKRFFNALSRKHFEESEHIAREGLLRSVDRGEVAAIKYYHEMVGEAPETKNLQVLLTRLVEAIQIHVKDPATLHAIEQSFGSIMNGQVIREIEDAGLSG